MFEKLARDNETLKAMVVDIGIQKAYETVKADMPELDKAVEIFDQKVHLTMEGWPKELVVRLILEENKMHCCEKECKHDKEQKILKKMYNHFKKDDEEFFV